MNKFFTLIFTFAIAVSIGQTTVDFENFQLDADTFLNGSDGSGGFSVENIFLPNDYNPMFDSWKGWAISNSTDVTTPGFMNQYSSITGGGAEASSNFAVAYVVGHNILELKNEAKGQIVNGFDITNNTYAYLNMKDGDNFTKRFGGVSGDDPDFLFLTIKAYFNGQLSTDSVDFYLADYRFADNSQDYIIDEWTFIDLTSLGQVDSLMFTFSSSDVGMFGINTPTYFCMDNFTTLDSTSSVSSIADHPSFRIFPNPAIEYLTIENQEGYELEVSIYDLLGKQIYISRFSDFQKNINVQNLSKGTYLLRINHEHQILSDLLIKQ